MFLNFNIISQFQPLSLREDISAEKMAVFASLLRVWLSLCLKISFYMNAPKRLMAQKEINSHIGAANEVIARVESSIQKHHDPTEYTSILACTGIDSSQEQNLLSATTSRALPNGRLAPAFGITNAFTATNENDQMKFRNKADKKLGTQNGEQLRELAGLARQILHEKIQISDAGRTRIHLITLVQTFSLKISLHMFFEQDFIVSDDEAVSSLASTINALWILSKNPYHYPESMKFHQDNFTKYLESLLHSYSLTYPHEKPMDFVIPAYETLWPVVLQGFIEIVFRHPSSAAVWRSVLAQYMAQPSAEQFSKPFTESPGRIPSISAKNLAQEAMRLYPPTKLVSFNFQYRTCPEIFAGVTNIEHIHCDRKLWGLDSKMYVPAWWTPEPGKVSRLFFPFGRKLMVCPAEGGFGAMMIAMLLAVLANEFDPGSWKLEGDEAGEIAMKEWMENLRRPLDSARRAHTSLYLCRKRDS